MLNILTILTKIAKAIENLLLRSWNRFDCNCPTLGFASIVVHDSVVQRVVPRGLSNFRGLIKHTWHVQPCRLVSTHFGDQLAVKLGR